MSAVVQAEVDTLFAAEALRDITFARTVLFALGAMLVASGAFLGALPATILGTFAIASGWYLQAWIVPKYEKDLRRARVAMGNALADLANVRLH